MNVPFPSFLCPNKVNPPNRSAISAFFQLGHALIIPLFKLSLKF